MIGAVGSGPERCQPTEGRPKGCEAIWLRSGTVPGPIV